MFKQREHKAEDTNAPASWGDQERMSWASSSAVGHGWRRTFAELDEKLWKEAGEGIFVSGRLKSRYYSQTNFA